MPPEFALVTQVDDEGSETQGIIERELSETRDALDAIIEVLRVRELELNDSQKETKKLRSLLSQSSERVTNTPNNRMALDNPDLAAKVSTLQNQIREMGEQQQLLVSHLKQAEDEVRKAQNLIPPLKPGTKRQMIKEEGEGGECGSMVKRSRTEDLYG